MKYPIATKQAKGRSTPLTAEMLVNMYAEQAPDGARNQVAAIGCPGLSLFSDISTAWGSYIRGLYHVTGNDTVWCVVGLTLYKVSSAGVATSIGTIGGYGRVSMADNGVELVVVADSISYVVTLASDTLTAITDSDFPNADTVAFLKGYFVFNNNQTGSKGQIFWSSLYGGATYDALDFGTAESLSDNLVAVWRDHDRVLLFGTHTTESWFASGDADAVFAPIPGSTINRGLGARWSIASLDNQVLFLDREGVVRIADGAGTRVSTHAIEHEIAKGAWRHDDANAYDGAVASSYIEEGHEFYVLTVPDTGTFVYDAATSLWHMRKSKELSHSRASFHISAFGTILCGDTETGYLYKQSLSFLTEAGASIIAEIQFPQIHNDGDRFRVHEIELFMETAPLTRGQEETVTGENIPIATTDGWSVGTISGGLIPPTISNTTEGVLINNTEQGGGHWARADFNNASPVSSRFVSRVKITNEGLPISGPVNITTGVLKDDASQSYSNEIYGNDTKWGINENTNNPRVRATGPDHPVLEEWFISEVAFDASGNRTYKINGEAHHTQTGSAPSGLFGYGFVTGNILADFVVEYAYYENSEGEIFLPGQASSLQSQAATAEGFVMLDVISDTNRNSDITQQTRSLGKVGEHGKRIIWRRLGQHRSFTPRFTISAATKRVLFDATARITADG